MPTTRRSRRFCGRGGNFCAGADLKVAAGARGADDRASRRARPDGADAHLLTKPVIAAVEGYAVAGGLELALWCDLRVVEEDATFGVFCRRWGVPLIDGGTVRLPRLIGHGRALDMILTGPRGRRGEALRWVWPIASCRKGEARAAAEALARELAALPQLCLRNDRLVGLRAVRHAASRGDGQRVPPWPDVLASGELRAGASRFAAGAGRHGAASS